MSRARDRQPRPSTKTARRTRERGIYASLLAFLLPLFIGSLGLGVDISHYWWVRGQLQNAADSAALAGAKELNSTGPERATATAIAATYADQHKVNGQQVTAADIAQNQTGKWQFSSKTFTPANVSDPSANAIRVTVQRADVPNFFARVLSGALATQTIAASAIGVAGGAGEVPCGFPLVVASCQIPTSSSNQITCPTSLSFQSGIGSVGLTHPDGSSPVNGNNTAPYIRGALNPATCNAPVSVGKQLFLQNGNDLQQTSVNDINTATANGANPIPIVLPVVDLPCGTNGPNYNQSANVVGFLKMNLIGARWTDDAPAAVAAACPTLGKKNVCVKAGCTMITGAPGGGTIQVSDDKVYLVR